MPIVLTQELKDRRTALLARLDAMANQAQSIAGRAAAANRETDANEQVRIAALHQEFAATEREVADLDQQIAAADERRAWDANVDPQASRPRQVAPSQPMTPDGAAPHPLARVIGAPGRATFDQVFGSIRGDATGGFPSFAAFGQAVAYNDTARLLPRNASGGMTSTTGADGGFAVPAAWAREIWNAALEMEIVRPRCRVFAMETGELFLPAWDTSNHSTGIAGFTGAWMAEASTASVQKGKLRQLHFKAKKLGIWTAVTRELAQDGGPVFGSFLGEALAKALASYFDRAFIRGSGAGQPLGIINSTSAVSVSKESGQAAATINATNVHKMLARLAPGSFANALWLAHPSTLPQLLQLQIKTPNRADNDDVSGFASPALTQSRDGSFAILTRPVLFTEHASQVGTVGDLVLLDPTQYAVAMRQDLRLEQDLGQHWLTDEIGYRMVARVDGMSLWDSAVTPVNGTDSLSWCVTLATR